MIGFKTLFKILIRFAFIWYKYGNIVYTRKAKLMIMDRQKEKERVPFSTLCSNKDYMP